MIGFDWYQATVPRPVDDVLEALGELAPGLALGHGKGHHGYAYSATLGNPEHGTVATVWHGGSHEYPHAVVTGDWAQPGAELIRARFPEHSVSRLDVREDFAGATTFDDLCPHLLAVAAQRRLQVGCAGDWALTHQARTLYLGSPKSDVRLRMYDKAAELRARFVHEWQAAVAGVPKHLTRVEAQIRPANAAAKRVAASVDPVEALGCSRWMRDVWNAVAGLDLEPVQLGRKWRPADDDRAWSYLLAQYGGLLRRRMLEHGSWAALGAQLGEDLS
jgi:hypothetical protein